MGSQQEPGPPLLRRGPNLSSQSSTTRAQLEVHNVLPHPNPLLLDDSNSVISSLKEEHD